MGGELVDYLMFLEKFLREILRSECGVCYLIFIGRVKDDKKRVNLLSLT